MPRDIDRAAVSDALARVATLDGGAPLATSSRLSEVIVRNGRVSLSISIAPGEAVAWEAVRAAAAAEIERVPGVTSVAAVLTTERQARPARAPGAGPTGTRALPSPAAPDPPRAASRPAFPQLAEVRHIIAVASGKGGVGKSTTACNLALALALGDGRRGPLRVGILDADIYGPSIPKLLALRGQPRILSGRLLEPMEAAGLKVMSIGSLVEAATAMIWRGPMVASAITQMLRDVAWGRLDVLVVDMPPGTGDAQLTLSQQARLSGAVIVSTPQELSLIDARRGAAMFRDVGVPILGLVENMSWFACDDCGKRHFPFGQGGARAEALRLGVPFLGEVPLDPLIRERSDAGLPVVLADPDGASAAAYRAIAGKVLQLIDTLGQNDPGR